MKKTYELWLDESGNFTQEAKAKEEAEKRGFQHKPSLIGGFLIEKEKLEEIDIDSLLQEGKTHANELSSKVKKEYIIPILEKMKELGAVQVFFENTEYEDENSSRQLYLRMMAEGLLQLLQTLNAEEESVSLEVLIAQRQDLKENETSEKTRIEEREYLTNLTDCIRAKKKGRFLFLHENSNIQFVIKAAHKEQKLQLADFVCNTRLTRDSAAFSECKERVQELYKNAYLFKLSEIGTSNYIKRCLVQYDIADALMELYLSRDKKEHKKMLRLIMDRIDKTNYRLMKSQLKQYTAEITAYAAKQEDYEIGEKILLKINKELIPLLRERKQPYHHLQITILLQLADMYLREGDIESAGKILKECEESHKSLVNQLEDMLLWYQLMEKQSLLCINSFDYEGAIAILKDVCEGFEGILKALESNNFVHKRFNSIDSEYYGDALCMRIYAMMFLQRENPESYKELCRLSDIALEQYPDKEEELERHRQYRSHIEMEAGNMEDAIRWLLMAKCYHPEKIGRDELVHFLDKICSNDDEIGRQYYLMYYLLVMCEAKLRNHRLAEEMHQALEVQKRMMKDLGFVQGEEQTDYQKVVLDGVKELDTGINYHPLEVVYWKYATYLMKSGKEWRACAYYKRALDICFKYSEYDTIQITGIGIMAEYICCLHQAGDKRDAGNVFEQMVKKLEELRKKILPEPTLNFVNKMYKLAKQAEGKKGKADVQILWELSRKITY